MDPVKGRALSPTAPIGKSDEDDCYAGQATLRRGIDSRDAVLEQARECSDIMILDSDDDSCLFAPTMKKDTCFADAVPPHTSPIHAQVIERRTLHSTLPNQDEALGRHSADRKRKLFDSKDRKSVV